MSSRTPENPFETDWETFRFPVRPVGWSEPVDEEYGDDEGDGGDDSSGGPRLLPGWAYLPEIMQLQHQHLKKKINLSDLDTGMKIIRLLAALERRLDLDVDGLIDALEMASMDCHGIGLSELVSAQGPSSRIVWQAPGDADDLDDHPEQATEARMGR